MKTRIIIFFCVVFVCCFISKNTLAQTLSIEYKYTGTVGNNSVEVVFIELDKWYNHLQGYYFYTKYNKKIEFRGEDGVFEGMVKLTESVNGKNTGYFVFYDLDYSKRKLTGKWYTMDGRKSYTVVLTKSNL